MGDFDTVIAVENWFGRVVRVEKIGGDADGLNEVVMIGVGGLGNEVGNDVEVEPEFGDKGLATMALA